MIFNDIKELLIQKFGTGVILGQETNGLQAALLIAPDSIDAVCLELRDNNQTYFDFLSCLSGVDYKTMQGGFGVVYQLASIPYQTTLTLKVYQDYDRAGDDLPTFKSISSVYRAAEWHEREAYDLLGIYFDGNPDLRRILLPDDWEGFPLRKDYVEAEEYKGIKIK